MIITITMHVHRDEGAKELLNYESGGIRRFA